jgi:hypothetical protein
MYQTGEGQQKGQGWAKRAIWGNVPDKDKKRFGSVDNITSKDFMNLWTSRVEKLMGGKQSAPTAVAQQAEPPLTQLNCLIMYLHFLLELSQKV